MANIKIKNASNCDKCLLSSSCNSKEDYNTFVETVITLANTYNSIKGKVSFKCHKEKTV